MRLSAILLCLFLAGCTDIDALKSRATQQLKDQASANQKAMVQAINKAVATATGPLKEQIESRTLSFTEERKRLIRERDAFKEGTRILDEQLQACEKEKRPINVVVQAPGVRTNCKPRYKLVNGKVVNGD